jgi:hypothetical protein
MKPADDLGQLLMEAAKIQPARDVDAAAMRYGSPELRAEEQGRDRILESADNTTLRLPAPFQTDGSILSGKGWKLTLALGWVARRVAARVISSLCAKLVEP